MTVDTEAPRPGPGSEARGAYRAGSDRGQATRAGGQRQGYPSLLDKGEVLASSTLDDVLARYGAEARGMGDERRLHVCPGCGGVGDLVANINGPFACHKCGAKGRDLFGLIALFLGVDVRRDFPAVLAEAADIAGVAPSDLSGPDRERRRLEAERARREREQASAERTAAARVEARQRAAAYWQSLWLRDRAGELYLRDRGLADIIGRDDVVRFTRPGAFGSHVSANEPAVVIRDRDGAPLSVTCRRFPERGEPKTPTMLACPTDGTLIGSIVDIRPGVDVVVGEGVVDSFTAVLAWPGAVVLGAAGAGRVPFVAALAAPVVLAAGGRMLIVPDADDRGEGAAIEAGRVAQRAGLVLGESLDVVDLGGHHDLNSAWCAGWRP